jgi:hypothetical protein
MERLALPIIQIWWSSIARLADGKESENYRTGHLNNILGARSHIIRFARYGPGVELLKYLAPGDGRPFPPDENAMTLCTVKPKW